VKWGWQRRRRSESNDYGLIIYYLLLQVNTI
jgi:hypothetical protein